MYSTQSLLKVSVHGAEGTAWPIAVERKSLRATVPDPRPQQLAEGEEAGWGRPLGRCPTACQGNVRAVNGCGRLAAQGFELHSRYKAEIIDPASTKRKGKLARQVFGE